MWDREVLGALFLDLHVVLHAFQHHADGAAVGELPGCAVDRKQYTLHDRPHVEPVAFAIHDNVAELYGLERP